MKFIKVILMALLSFDVLVLQAQDNDMMQLMQNASKESAKSKSGNDDKATVAVPKDISGVDVTPGDLKDKFYKFNKGKREDRSLADRMFSNPQDTWFSSYCKPVNGFVILNTGEKVTGQMIIHERHNGTYGISYDSTYMFAGGQEHKKVYDPTGKSVIQDVSITLSDGSKKVFSDKIAEYGLLFKPSDWAPVKRSKVPADHFNPGFIRYKDGTVREGLVALATMSYESKGDLRIYKRIFFADNAFANVESFFVPGYKPMSVPHVNEAVQIVAGDSIDYPLVNGGLVDQDSWIKSFLANPRKNDLDPPALGKLYLRNNVTLNGRVFMSRYKKKSYAYLVDQDNDLF